MASELVQGGANTLRIHHSAAKWRHPLESQDLPATDQRTEQLESSHTAGYNGIDIYFEHKTEWRGGERVKTNPTSRRVLHWPSTCAQPPGMSLYQRGSFAVDHRRKDTGATCNVATKEQISITISCKMMDGGGRTTRLFLHGAGASHLTQNFHIFLHTQKRPSGVCNKTDVFVDRRGSNSFISPWGS